MQGLKVKKEKSALVTHKKVSIPIDLHMKLKTLAAVDNSYIQDHAAEAIKQYLNRISKRISYKGEGS